MKVILTTIAFFISAVFSTLLIAEVGEVTIPADSVVKQRDGKNFFLSLPDKLFKPYAELLITSEHSSCAKIVFFGNRGKYNTMGGTFLPLRAKDARELLLIEQRSCHSSLDGHAYRLLTDTGIAKLYKLTPASEMSKSGHIFDPRVYERAKKTIGVSTTKKKEGK